MTPAASALLAATAGGFPTEPFVVALSGGADSAVLAWLSTQVQPPERLLAVFVHHGWPDSDHQQTAAQRIADELGLTYECVLAVASSTETEARLLRLEALERAAGDRPVVTGHHADDVAETVLRNVARGAGAAGLAGIPQARHGYVRPLLGATRQQLRTVALEFDLPFVDDPANADPAPQRNIIRSEVLPRLDAAVPGAAAGLRRSAELAAADDRLIEARVDEVPIRRDGGAVSVPAAALVVLPGPVASRLVRRMVRLLRPPYAGDRRMVNAALAAAGGPAVDLGDGLRAVREGAVLTIHDATRPPADPGPVPLVVPSAIDFGSHRLVARLCRPSAVPVRGRQLAELDASIADGLKVRSPGEGDRIDIGGGHKLVSDALNESAIPLRLRSTWPLVIAHGKIVWIAGVRLAAWARPQREAGQVLELTTERH